MNESQIPPPTDMVSIVHQLIELEENLSGSDQKLCIISAKWFNRMKESIGYEFNSSSSFVPISPIDNSVLLDNQFSKITDTNKFTMKTTMNRTSSDAESKNDDLKEIPLTLPTNLIHIQSQLQEHIDYEIIPITLYNKLHSWFKGGPLIQVTVEYDPFTNSKRIFVNQPQYEIYYKSQKDYGQIHKQTFEFSPYKPISELILRACTFFKTNPQRVRLWDYFKKTQLMILDSSKMPAYYGLDDLSSLFLEEMRDDDSWPIQFANVNSAYWSSIDLCDPGLHGLDNYANICFLNSSLQCFFHTNCLIDYFVRPQSHETDETDAPLSFWATDLKKALTIPNPKGTQGRLVDAFSELMRTEWQRANPVMIPRFFKEIIYEKCPEFSEKGKQDAHKLIKLMLDLMHEDLNICSETDTKQGSISSQMALFPDDVFAFPSHKSRNAKIAWKNYIHENHSFFSKNFHGMYKSKLTCTKCGAETISYDPFTTVSVPTPMSFLKTTPFLFVPWDLNAPRTKMQLKLSSPTVIDEAVDVLSHRMGRKMMIIFGEHIYNSIEINWLQKLEPSSRDCKIIAFELPPSAVDIQERLKKHQNDEIGLVSAPIYAQVRMQVQIENKGRLIHHQIDPFNLVELPSENPTNAEIERACEIRFAQLFEPTPTQINEQESSSTSFELNSQSSLQPTVINIDTTDKKPPIQTPTGNQYLQNEYASLENSLLADPQFNDVISKLNSDNSSHEKGQKIDVKIASRGYETNVSFERDSLVPLATKRRIEIRFNPSIMQDPKQCNWVCLKNIIDSDYAYWALPFSSTVMNERFNDINRTNAKSRKKKNDIENDESNSRESITSFSLKECLQLLISHNPENIGQCPTCNEMVHISKQVEIQKAPKILIIHFDRFINNKYNVRKIDAKAYYPNVLDLSPFLSSSYFSDDDDFDLNTEVELHSIDYSDENGFGEFYPTESIPKKSKDGKSTEHNCTYKLFGIIEHIGSMSGGHYIAYSTKNGDDWYKFNDSLVQKVKLPKVHTTDAYILFYQKV